MKTVLPLAQIGLYGLGAVLAGVVLDACFRAYADPSLAVGLVTSLFLCQ